MTSRREKDKKARRNARRMLDKKIRFLETAAASLANHHTHLELGVSAFDCAACNGEDV